MLLFYPGAKSRRWAHREYNEDLIIDAQFVQIVRCGSVIILSEKVAIRQGLAGYLLRVKCKLLTELKALSFYLPKLLRNAVRPNSKYVRFVALSVNWTKKLMRYSGLTWFRTHSFWF